jgi:hypothetical protein
MGISRGDWPTFRNEFSEKVASSMLRSEPDSELLTCLGYGLHYYSKFPTEAAPIVSLIQWELDRREHNRSFRIMVSLTFISILLALSQLIAPLI